MYLIYTIGDHAARVGGVTESRRQSFVSSERAWTSHAFREQGQLVPCCSLGPSLLLD